MGKFSKIENFESFIGKSLEEDNSNYIGQRSKAKAEILHKVLETDNKPRGFGFFVKFAYSLPLIAFILVLAVSYNKVILSKPTTNDEIDNAVSEIDQALYDLEKNESGFEVSEFGSFD